MKQHCYNFFKLITLFAFLFPLALLAQEDANTKAEKELEDNIYAFAKAYASIPETKDKGSVLKYFSRKFRSTIFYFSVSEKAKSQTSNYDGFNGYLDGLLLAENMLIKYDVKEIIRNHVSGDVGTTVFVVEYELNQDGGVHVKGHETVTMAWKRIDGLWQVVHFTVLGTEDEKFSGTCLCEIFASQGDQFIVKTTVPSGRSYNTSFNEFQSRQADQETYIKTSDNTVFKLASNGEVWQQNGSLSSIDKLDEVQRLGKAGGVKGALLLIIQHHIYPDNCTKIQYKD